MRFSGFQIPFIVILVLCLTGCLLETETAITPDTKVDPRLEGVWQITPKLPHEIRGDRDEDDIGVYGYIIITPLKNANGPNDPASYKALAFDSFEDDSPSKFPEMIISTRNHKGRDLLLVRLADYEKEDEGLAFKNWILDYEFNQNGELFLRFWFVEDFDELQKAHPMKFENSGEPFAPITLKGDEGSLLEFYTDPKVRALLSSMGKYRMLVPQVISSNE
ncbi:MAG: hypothetical protein ACSHX9_08410 [Luteolibacter sp.]